jgi:hypothetical protein
VTGGNITGNNKVRRRVTFAAITTSKIRVLVNNALNVTAESQKWKHAVEGSGDHPELHHGNCTTDYPEVSKRKIFALSYSFLRKSAPMTGKQLGTPFSSVRQIKELALAVSVSAS